MHLLTPRGAGLVTTALLSLGLVLGATPVAHADAAPIQVSVTNADPSVNASAKEIKGIAFRFSEAPPVGTQIHVSAFSCGNFLQESSDTATGDGYDALAYVWFSPDGTPGVVGNPVARKVGKSIEYQIDILQPGYDAYHLAGSVTDYGTVDGQPVSSYRPTCEQINGGGTGGTQCVVNAKAKKVGQARVGHTVKVRKPKTNGACGRTSYTWKVAGKTVKKGKTLFIGKGMRGKGVTVKVSLSKGPDKSLRFGRVK